MKSGESLVEKIILHAHFIMVSTPKQHSHVAGTDQKKRVSPACVEHSALSLSSGGGGNGRRGTQVKDWRGGREEVEGRMDGEREGRMDGESEGRMDGEREGRMDGEREGKRGGETERAEGGGRMQ